MGLGASEAQILSELVAENKQIFTIEELARKTGSREKARSMASKLVKKNWLERIAKGVYLTLELSAGKTPEWTQDSYYIASKLASPYYIGFYNTLNHYGWTEQVPLTINIAVTKPLKSREIHGVRYNFVCLSKKKFFGTAKQNIHGHEIVISDPEKTLVDALDHPEYCGGIEEVAKAVYFARPFIDSLQDPKPYVSHRNTPEQNREVMRGATKIDWEKVLEYAEKQGNGAVFKRLGFICELMEITLPPGLKNKIKRKVTKGYSSLSPGSPSKGRHDSKWNLILNVEITKQSVLA
ncbi:MAG: type IV toxin-antitoxin system AbiEi family antitoxin [Candidatus Micrarchaeota archaeon]